jgi:hypothetical protein
MFSPVDFRQELGRLREKERRQEDLVLQEANRILQTDLFHENKILNYLNDYGRTFEHLDEEDVIAENIFTEEEVKKLAVRHRLKFLSSSLYRSEIPYQAVLKIKDLNQKHRKDLKHFFVLAQPSAFFQSGQIPQSALFVSTNNGNYFMLHRWGGDLSWSRKFKFWPMRSFENLFATVLVIALLVTLVLPTALITLDSKAEYWSGYRAAAFFHLLIFFGGFTTYLTFAFAGNFSNVVWNRKKDFG